MQLLMASAVSRSRVQRRFGHSALGALLGLLVVGKALEFSRLLGWLVLVGAVVHMLRAAFRPSNWVLQLTEDGVLLQVRSYLNHHFPDDGPTVVHLPFAEIASACKRVEKKRVPGHKGAELRSQSYLELRLTHDDTEDLRCLVAKEQARKAPEQRRLGVGSRTKFRHVPVRVPEPVDDRILDLVEEGKTIPAVRLLREEYGMDLTRTLSQSAASDAPKPTRSSPSPEPAELHRR